MAMLTQLDFLCFHNAFNAKHQAIQEAHNYIWEECDEVARAMLCKFFMPKPFVEYLVFLERFYVKYGPTEFKTEWVCLNVSACVVAWIRNLSFK